MIDYMKKTAELEPEINIAEGLKKAPQK